MAESSHAVFLSYASQDVEAAQRICAALRAAGIEVWFDQSELRGGDAWDQSIRRQIKNCALFIPIVSRHTHERAEGYFRLEWKLAVDRSHLIMANRAFLVPVIIDDTRDDDENVPDRFKEVQWTHLPGGETPGAFVERVKHLLSGAVSKTTRAGPSGTGHDPSSSRPKRVLPAAVAGVIAVALLFVLGFFALERLRGSRPSVQDESIAVLPFANEGGDAKEQYFSDGISEDLITALAQFPGLKVIGRTSSFQFRDSKEDSRGIGERLHVAHLLEGSVRRSGDVVRVSAELINAADGSAQWSERYDRPYTDLFALQDEITRAVAGALKARLLPDQHAAAQSERPPSGNLEAYNALLQGRFYEARRTEVDIRAGIEQYTVATRLDPHYAQAWSALSRAWAELGTDFSDTVNMQLAYAQARTAAATALAGAPDLAASHLAHGNVLKNADLDWRGAAAEFRHALELAPNDGEAKFYLGNQLATLGQVEKGVELTRQALATDPLRADWYDSLASYLAGLNRLEEAERTIRKAIELQPGAVTYHWTLAAIEVQRGDAPAAFAAALQEPRPGWQVVAVALARQIGGDGAAADAALNTLINQLAGLAAYQIAEVYAVRKDAGNTFEWLDRAWSNRDPGLGTLLYDPFILRFRDDPRLAAFCHKIGLPVPGEAADSAQAARE